MSNITIVPYDACYYDDYRNLNYAWIEKYFTVEDEDRAKLDHPQENILDKGGSIYMALLGDSVVGTCTLLYHGDGRYELSKMAVTPAAQGKQIGYKLGLHVIVTAKNLGGTSIFLETNDMLKPALKLYEKLGFQEMVDTPSPYARCNVQLEISF